MTRDQLKYCAAIMRTLKKHRDANAFLQPVDVVQLNVPDYFKIIKYPMDLGTIDEKLSQYQYENVRDFISDVRLVFNNCYKFNGPEAMISMLCQNVESAFEKSLRQMPPSREQPSPPPSTSPEPLSVKAGTKRKGRPKREIHPPRSKDYPEPMTKRPNPRKMDVQMKFCGQVLRELKKSKYRDINFPFLAPVDIVALNIPDYPTIVTHPMDISTIERKLIEGEYDSPAAFESDVRLMFNNCYKYNPPMIPVHKMGRELEKVFDEKWKLMPELPPPQPVKKNRRIEEESDEESDDYDDNPLIAKMQRDLEKMSKQLEDMKSKAKAGDKGHAKAAAKSSAPQPPRQRKRPPQRPKLKEDDVSKLTFEEKRLLSDKINSLEGDELTMVIDIIQSSMPNLGGEYDSLTSSYHAVQEEEIELDIDQLDSATLQKLYNIVLGNSRRQVKSKPRPKPKPKAKENKRQNGAGNSSSDSESGSSSSGDSDDSGSSSEG
ncbi:Bromodomain-containing protein [Syncephalastrum racemosum]|uniref:Bromodomain-containing protein n=1 Tax=Syncephalastrum racemosum TaxID=13706 RepID=A0A1X2HEJ1_SYNRA|nr:Bromodomain-containing protein [Syncephalastrum racemosum]